MLGRITTTTEATVSVVGMALSVTRQRNAVSEGMAFGLVMCGRYTLPFNKLAVDLSFESAFRRWSYASRFRQVGTDMRHGLDGYLAMTRADERKQVHNFFWGREDGKLCIFARSQWADGEIDPREVAESIDGDVPASGWKELAEAFLVRFERG